MSNVHLQEAARNVRRAVGDLNTRVQQVKAETEQQVHEIERRLNDIKIEQGGMAILMSQEDSDMSKTGQSNHIRDLKQEADQLNKDIFTLHDNYRKVESDTNNQTAEFENLAQRLETTE